MADSSLIAGLRSWLITCPLLKDGYMGVDYLGVKPTEYSVDILPAVKILKSYIDGTSIRQFVFAFSSVEEYGVDVENNIANTRFYEDFSRWLEKMNRDKDLPAMDEGRAPLEISAEGDGYIVENSENTARYQVQCRLVYMQKGDY